MYIYIYRERERIIRRRKRESAGVEAPRLPDPYSADWAWSPEGCIALRVPGSAQIATTVSSRKFQAQNVKVRVSNPRTTACLNLKIEMPFEGSKPNAFFQIKISETCGSKGV